jgi:hypothetical protein
MKPVILYIVRLVGPIINRKTVENVDKISMRGEGVTNLNFGIFKLELISVNV